MIGSIGIAGSVLLSTLLVLLYCYVKGAPPLAIDQNTHVYSVAEEVIGVERGSENRYWVELEEISPHVIESTLTTEDKRFYDHLGFDMKRMASAAMKDLKHMAMVEGASTITQQYARNLYLSHEKTWTRKWNEALYALRLEMFYDKDTILEGYLNTIYYGHGMYGIEAASRYYFDKHASELSLAEAATLAAVPKGPTYYSPYTQYENAKQRQELILSNMKKQGVISEQAYTLAIAEPLELTEHNEERAKRMAPYFQDTVLVEAARHLDTDLESIRSGGYHIYTTLDVSKQEELEQAVNEHMPPSSLEVGAMSMHPDTGAVVAMVGGTDYERSQYNRAVSSKRMAGSTFKPFLYYAALEHGYTPSTTLMSEQTTFELKDGTAYAPSNFHGYYADAPITLAQAIALSDNIYAVKTNLFMGTEELVDVARQFGIKSKLPSVPSLALGTASVSVSEMTEGYSLIANNGKESPAHTIVRITDRHNHVVYERTEDEPKQKLDESKAFVLAHLMTGMFDESLNDYMRVTGASVSPKLTRPYAGKSGTTETDSWMIGFTPSLVTGIWTGYDDNKELTLGDQTVSKQIWTSYMEDAHKKETIETFNPTGDVVGVYVDPDTGKLATPYCVSPRLTYFESGTEPTEYCHDHMPSEEELPEQSPSQPTPEKKGVRKWFDWLF